MTMGTVRFAAAAAMMVVSSGAAPKPAQPAQSFQGLAGVTMSPDGHVVVADRGGHAVFAIDPANGQTRVIAGVGEAGFAGDGGPAVRAAFRNPEWVQYDSAGNLWVADRGNGRVRVVDAGTGIVRTRVGADSLTSPFGLLVSARDVVFIFDTEAHTIRRFDPTTDRLAAVVGDGTAGFHGDGGPGRAAQTRRPHNGVFDAAGRLVFGDSFNHRIRRWDPATDRIETIAGTGEEGRPRVGATALASPFTYFGAMVVERDGSIVFTSTVDNQILRIRAADQIIEIVAGSGEEGFAGDGGPAPAARLRFPYGLAIDTSGHLYVADAGNQRVRRVHRDSGTIETIAGG